MSRPRKYSNDAERQAAFKARHQLVTLSVTLPVDVIEGLDQYLRFKDVTKAAVIEKLIRTQLLRKR